MVELSLWANTAHSLADSDKERLSQKQSLLQALPLQKPCKSKAFQLLKFKLHLFIHFLEEKKDFRVLIIGLDILGNSEDTNCHLLAALFVVSA